MKDVDLETIATKSNFSVDQVRALVESWRKGRTSEKLHQKDFDKLLQKVHAAFPHPGLAESGFRTSLFQLFDRDNNKELDFDEVLTGLSVLCKGDIKEKAGLVFDCFDSNRDGNLSREELKVALTKSVENGGILIQQQTRDTCKEIRTKEGRKLPGLFIYSVTQVVTDDYYKIHSEDELNKFQEKLFEIYKNNSDIITKEDWVLNCDSNIYLKHFLEFNCGDFIRQLDLNVLGQQSNAETEQAFKSLASTYSPLVFREDSPHSPNSPDSPDSPDSHDSPRIEKSEHRPSLSQKENPNLTSSSQSHKLNQ